MAHIFLKSSRSSSPSADAAPIDASNRGGAETTTTKTKRQPWQEFVHIRANDQHANGPWAISDEKVIGADEVRLLGELDDKDLGG